MVISEVAIKRPVFISMVILAIIVFGVVSYPKINVDMYPDVEFPIATVLTIYPGADPETIEKEVTEPIEDAVSTINGVRTLQSVSAENVSQVIVIFELEMTVDTVIQDVRDKISRIIPTLPKEVEAPKIEKFELGAIPIITLAVGGPGAIDEVTRFARKRVKEQLQQVPGVGSVDMIGGQEREIKIWVDPDKLKTMGLAVTDVIQSLAVSNLKFPGGRLSAGDTEFVVKVDGEFKSVQAIENLIIREVMGRKIRVGDVARVEDGIEEMRSAARLDAARAVSLLVRKQSGANAVATAERVKARLAELQAGFPAGWKATLAADTTIFTQTMIEHVQFDMIFGALLAVIIIFFFLRNARSTLISAVAIPTSVIGAFTFIKAMGFTFNTLTLLALSLSIGILIDDAIVVLENIYRHMEEGKSPWEAAKTATEEIGLAVLAVTMSIVAVFVPVAFMEGIVGRFFYQFGLTVTVAVLLSLFVSLTLTPMLCSRLLGKSGDNAFYRLIERFLAAIDRVYRGTIAWALAHRRTTMGIAAAIFVASLYMVRFVGVEFQPRPDMSEFNITVQLPTGASLEATDRVAMDVARRARRHADLVTTTVTTIGSDAQQKQNLAKIYVKMRDKGERAISQTEFMAQLREEFKDVSGAAVSVAQIDQFAESSGMRAAQLQYIVQGGDLVELDRTTRRIVAELKKTPGFVDLDTSFEGGKPEVNVAIDQAKTARLGLVTALVGQTVNALVGGYEASKFREAGEDYSIRVRLNPADRNSAADLEGLDIRSLNGQLVDLSSVTTISPGTGPTQIDRLARERQISVFGNLDESLPLGQASVIVEETAEKMMASGQTGHFEGMTRIMKESFQHMLFSLVLAVIIVYMVLASQFESLVHPLTIMFSLPLSLVGAIGALLLTGQTLSITSMIGIIMLMGLVTKNAILLIDYTNTLRRRDGMGRTEALLRAGPVRLRPILMTTGAMVFGMLPVAMSRGYGAELRSPMAVCVIGGLIASTLLTLVVVPVVYTILDDIGQNAFVRRLTAAVLSHREAGRAKSEAEAEG
ncbi:MAG: efflux RND transporter permease subunit [Myxococcales bacterium]|nr:MAG: efflux RND transporter permease subunit [Myxococcales bacterium]